MLTITVTTTETTAPERPNRRPEPRPDEVPPPYFYRAWDASPRWRRYLERLRRWERDQAEEHARQASRGRL